MVVALGEETLNAPGELEALTHPEAAPLWGALHGKLEALVTAYQGAEAAMPLIIDARRQVPTKYAVSALNEGSSGPGSQR